jgi:hypothetical protein
MFDAYLIDEFANKHPLPKTGPQIRITRGVLHLPPHHENVVYDGSLWKNHSVRFLALRIDGAARLHFENDEGEASERFGPYSPTMLVDGSIRFGAGDANLHTAWLDRDNMLWQENKSGRYWPVVVLSQGM